jgi:membrane-bound ClpP family serine protease
MLIFAALALAAFVIVAGAFLFGHDHDVDGDHDGGHDVLGDGEPAVSIFSTKVIGALLMGFGAAGAMARYHQMGYVVSSLIGLLTGLVMGGLMYGMLSLFYRQQSSSLVPTNAAIGGTGTVTVSIAEGAVGEVGITVNGIYTVYSASAKDGGAIPKGQAVRVVQTRGSHLVVVKTA